MGFLNNINNERPDDESSLSKWRLLTVEVPLKNRMDSVNRTLIPQRGAY